MPPNAGEVARPQSPLRSIMPQSPLRIKQDGKFYERLLTKESSAANPSFRFYWAEPGSVPFVWESQPGTPRDASRTAGGALVPAITPPPSYLLRHGGGKVQETTASRHPKSKAKGKNWCRLKRIKVGFIAGIFRRLALGKAWCRRSAPSLAQVSSSSRWLFSSVATDHHQQQRRHHHHHHDQEPAAQKNTELCSPASPSPWMPRFRGLVSRNRDEGWA